MFNSLNHRHKNNKRCSVDTTGGRQITGGYTGAAFRDSKEERELAKRLYSEFGTIEDIQAIAKNLGVEEDEVERVFYHLLRREHYIEGKWQRFLPSLDQARAIENLIDGNFTDLDRLLYNHEAYESMLMEEQDLDYNEAHEKADELYPWASEKYGGR